MRPRLNIYTKNFFLNFGWYAGEEFTLFCLDIFDVQTNYNNTKVDLVTLFLIKIAKFLFSFGWKSY